MQATQKHSLSRPSSTFTIYHWILHFADISTPTLEWDEYLQHTQHCLKEFINEAALNVKDELEPQSPAIIPWYNLLKPGKPVTYEQVQPIFHNSQNEFINYVVQPHLYHIYWFRLRDVAFNRRIESLYVKLANALEGTLSKLKANNIGDITKTDASYHKCVQALVTFINQRKQPGGKRSRTLQRRTRRSVKAWGGMDNDPSENMTGRLQVKVEAETMTNSILKMTGLGKSMSWKYAVCSYNPNTRIFKYTPENSMGIPETPIEVKVIDAQLYEKKRTEDVDTHRKFCIVSDTQRIKLKAASDAEAAKWLHFVRNSIPSGNDSKGKDETVETRKKNSLNHNNLAVWIAKAKTGGDTDFNNFYYNNPYHNRGHASYVCEKATELYVYLFPENHSNKRNELQIAALFHDCKHPGVGTYAAAKTFANNADIGRLSDYLKDLSLDDSSIQAAGTELALEDVHAAIFEKAMGKTFAQYGLDVQFIAELIRYTQMNLWKEESTRREGTERTFLEATRPENDPRFTEYLYSILRHIGGLLKLDEKVNSKVSKAEYQFSVKHGIPLCITQYLMGRKSYKTLREEMNRMNEMNLQDPRLYENILGPFTLGEKKYNSRGRWSHSQHSKCCIKYDGMYNDAKWKIINEQGSATLYHEDKDAYLPPSTGWKYIESNKECPINIKIDIKHKILNIMPTVTNEPIINEPIIQEIINILRKQASVPSLKDENEALKKALVNVTDALKGKHTVTPSPPSTPPPSTPPPSTPPPSTPPPSTPPPSTPPPSTPPPSTPTAPTTAQRFKNPNNQKAFERFDKNKKFKQELRRRPRGITADKSTGRSGNTSASDM